jgi:hypothetical protein
MAKKEEHYGMEGKERIGRGILEEMSFDHAWRCK